MCISDSCYRDESGALRYSWQYVDSLFDALLAMGVRPFVEFLSLIHI